MNTEEVELDTRIKEGMVLRLSQTGLVEVIMVNGSRARVKSLTKEKVKIHSVFGDDVEFNRSGREFDISPNSECEIISTK
jgi:hypothetical protein